MKPTVGALIERFIEEMRQIGMKPLGATHLICLHALQRAPIAQKVAEALKKSDIIDHCKMRRTKVQAATVTHDITYLSGVLKYAGSAWADCEDVSAAAIDTARPFLVKYQLIGKSTPRKRVPTDEEIERLVSYFVERANDKRVKINMVPMILFALASTRRISEICRITHGDIDWDRKDDEGNPMPMYTVRNLKHPKKKQGNDKTFAMLAPMPEIIKMQPRMTDDPNERVFPFNAKSSGAAYTRAKKQLGIVNLRFHDNRRDAITYWLAVFKNPHKVKLISGHETTQILERVYDATDPATLHEEIASIERAKIAVPALGTVR